MDRTTLRRKQFLACSSAALWGLSLILVPFGTELPGVYLLILVCSIGMIYPTIMPIGVLNYWYVWLIICILARRESRRMGASFLLVFGMCILYLLVDQYLLLGYYKAGELRIGAVVWMLALGMAGKAAVLGHPIGSGGQGSARSELGTVKRVTAGSVPGERSQ